MSKIARLHEPTPSGNRFYQLALSTDFSKIETIADIRSSFDLRLDGLIEEIESCVAPLGSVTQVAETLHFSALAAGLIQCKARHREAVLKSKLPPEESVSNMILQEFNMNSSSDQKGVISAQELDIPFSYSRRSKASPNEAVREAANKTMEMGILMEQDFAYTGKAMRALSIIALLRDASGMLQHSEVIHDLMEYDATQALYIESESQPYPVIGIPKVESWSSIYSMNESPRRKKKIWFEDNSDFPFSLVFRRKVAQLLALDDMFFTDRVRLEELRNFCFDTVCRTMFGIKAINFPRVIQLVMAVKENTDASGRIFEDDLLRIIPSECAALADRESLLTRDFEDVGGVFYRINSGLKSFTRLVEQFSLLRDYTPMLVQEALRNL